MFWAGFGVGVFVGASVGAAIAAVLFARRRDSEDLLSESSVDFVVNDGAEEDQADMPLQPKPITYLDKYPHS